VAYKQQNVCLTVLQTRQDKNACISNRHFVPFLTHRWLSGHNLMWWKRKNSLCGLLYKGTNSIYEGSTFITNHQPRTLPLNIIILGIRNSHKHLWGTQTWSPQYSLFNKAIKIYEKKMWNDNNIRLGIETASQMEHTIVERIVENSCGTLGRSLNHISTG
jgi:hypothetical protein